MSFEQSTKSVAEVLLPLKTAFSRYWSVSWAPAFAIALLIGVVAVFLPSYYESDVRIFIQPQKISSKIVDQPDSLAQRERFEALVQELISRPRLRSIVDKFELYPDFRGAVGKEKATYKLHSDISISPVVSPSGKALSQTFLVSYRHSDAQTAFDVTKALSNLFIEESIINQRSETRGTEEFLDSQLREARKRLEATEGRVKEFSKVNAGKLPEHAEEAMARLKNAQDQFATTSQLLQTSLARLEFLERELQLSLKNSGDMLASDSGKPGESSDPVKNLAQLERALVILRSRYSEKHPDIMATRQRISALKRRIKAQAKASGDNSGRDKKMASIIATADPHVRKLRLDINEAKVSIEALGAEAKRLKKQVALLDKDIKDMPLKEIELTEISRGYRNEKANYEKLLAAKEDAALKSSLVRSHKSSQFKVVDPPYLPMVPSGPPRLIIGSIGLVVGLAVLFLMPLLLFWCNGSFKFKDEAEDELEVPVLGVVPPMQTPAYVLSNKRANATSVAASLISLVVGAVLILLVV